MKYKTQCQKYILKSVYMQLFIQSAKVIPRRRPTKSSIILMVKIQTDGIKRSQTSQNVAAQFQFLKNQSLYQLTIMHACLSVSVTPSWTSRKERKNLPLLNFYSVFIFSACQALGSNNSKLFKEKLYKCSRHRKR